MKRNSFSALGFHDALRLLALRYRIRKALEFQIEFLFPLTHSRKLCVQAGILLAQGFFHLRDGIIDHLSLADGFRQAFQQALFEFIPANE